MPKPLSVSTPNLKVVFSKSTDNPDRWSHQILMITEVEETVLLTSVEGTDQETWPASAPLQDISHHDLPTGQAILGVGMAGKSHWSASVSIEDDAAVFFDMACLIKTENATVGSQYCVGPSVTVKTDENDIRLETGGKAILLRPHHPPEKRTKFAIEGTKLTVHPDVETKSLTGSVRWCFRFCTE